MKKILAVVALAIATAPSVSNACSCIPPGSPSEELQQSDRVFLGEVTRVERRTPEMDHGLAWSIRHWFDELLGRIDPPETRHFPYQRISFNVFETFKGNNSRSVSLATGLGGGDCGYSFEVGVKYVVYANGTDSALGTGICSLTGRASDPSSGLIELRRGS